MGYVSDDFNPRTRVECDAAPGPQSWTDSYFNPRTRVECDLDAFGIKYDPRLFQSTHSCRVRLV